MLEHAGLMVYLWGVLGSLSTIFLIVVTILAVAIGITFLFLVLENESINILFVKTEKEFNSKVKHYASVPYTGLCLAKKAFKWLIFAILLIIFIPSQSQIIKIIVAQPIVNTTKTVLTPKNLVKIQKIVNVQLDKLSK